MAKMVERRMEERGMDVDVDGFGRVLKGGFEEGGEEDSWDDFDVCDFRPLVSCVSNT